MSEEKSIKKAGEEKETAATAAAAGAMESSATENEEKEAAGQEQAAGIEQKAKEVPAEKQTAEKNAKKAKKRKFRRQVQRGCAFIRSSYNNTVVSFTDLHGNMLAWSSSGLLGFKGAKKATTYAATQVVTDVHEKCQKYGLKDIEVFIRGVGSGREAALRSLAQRGYNIIKIKDITPIPHNGCRPKKPRRV